MKRSNYDKILIALAKGVSRYAKKYSGYIINGYRFLTKRRERYRRTQNSGVMVEAEGGHYYGAVTEIVELDYFSTCKVVLFRCDWVDIRPSRGLKNDKFGFPMVNFSRLMHTGQALKDDPFIVASQARQVFYVGDQREAGWSHVVITKPRDLFDMGPNLDRGVDECYPECIPFIIPGVDLSDMSSWRRLDIQEEED